MIHKSNNKSLPQIKTFFAGLLMICLAALPQMVSASDITSERIKGVTRFLIERAEDNYLYILEQKMADNRILQCYFPNTHYFATNGNLKALLNSGKEVWIDNVEMDLQGYLEFYVIEQIGEPVFVELVKNLSTDLKKNLNDLQTKFDKVREFVVNSTELLPDKKQLALSRLAEYDVGLNSLKAKVEQLGKFKDSGQEAEPDVCKENTPAWRDSVKNKYREFHALLRSIGKEGKILFSNIAEDLDDGLLVIIAGIGLAGGNTAIGGGSINVSTANQADSGINSEIFASVNKKKSLVWWAEFLLDEMADSKEVESSLSTSRTRVQDSIASEKRKIEEAIKKKQEDLRESAQEKLNDYMLELEYIKNRKATIRKIIAIANADKPVYLKFVEFERLITQEISRFSEKAQVAMITSSKSYAFSYGSKEYQRFRKYVLFFAQLTEAESADQVEALLSSVTLPSVSFGLKRESGERHLAISAYMGGAVGRERPSDENYTGLAVPLGFEWSYGCQSRKEKRGEWWRRGCPDKYSFNIMVAPFDFAHPVNLELEGKDDSVELKDIVIPGVFASLGLGDWPLAVGLGWQRGRAIKTEEENEDRVLIFLAFELPLYVLF